MNKKQRKKQTTRKYWKKNKEKIKKRMRAYKNRPEVKARLQKPIEKAKRKKYLKKYNEDKTTILINKEIMEALRKMKREGETFSDLLERLLK